MSTALFPYLVAGLAGALLAVAVGAIACGRVQAKMRRLTDALDHMSQGLCMFDAAGRILVCNRPYMRMYKLSADVVKPGCTLRELLEHRRQTGLFTGDPDQYSKEIMDGVAAGSISKWIVSASDGRTVHAINAPMPNGGWDLRTRASPNNKSCSSSATTLPGSRSGAAQSMPQSRPSARAWRRCSSRSAIVPRR